MTQTNADNACWCPHCSTEVSPTSKRMADGDLAVCERCAHILVYKRVSNETRPVNQKGGVYRCGGILKLTFATDDDFLVLENAPFEIEHTKRGRMKLKGFI